MSYETCDSDQQLIVGESNWEELQNDGWRFLSNLTVSDPESYATIDGISTARGNENVATGNAFVRTEDYPEGRPSGASRQLGLYIRSEESAQAES